MACNPLIIWRPIPPGSRFTPSTDGDASAYNVTVFITRNGQAELPLRHGQVASEQAEVTIAAGEEYVFDVVLTLNQVPAQGITLDLRVVGNDKQPVSVADGAGGQRPASCSSSFNDPADSPILIKVIALA
ncbi:MAG TPA: hypothetical protein VGF69_21780 [Thermoanaerobaculia bacterium]|jgi:hypothetical protein